MKSPLAKLIAAVLYWEAMFFRSRYRGPVVTISGSVGKTSVKEAIGQMTRRAYGEFSLVTPKSLNTEFGVPLTLLGFQKTPHGFGWLTAIFRGLLTAFLGASPKCIVLELGADRPGDMAYLGRLARPTHAVITSASEAHSANFSSVAAMKDEEAAITRFVGLDGVVVVNADDLFLAKLSVAPGQTKVTCRLHVHADYFASGTRVTLDGTAAVIHHRNRTQRVQVSRYGEHQIYSVLFAAAIGDALGISRDIQVETFKGLKPVAGRGALLPGLKNSWIIDESYNAQPEAMRLALQLLGQMPGRKRVAVLGDMRELKTPEPVHRAIGAMARQVSDVVIGIGPLARSYKADSWFLTAQEAAPAVLSQLGDGVIVLVKGSQNTIRLERLVKAIMRQPERANDLLVRQEKEWQKIP